MFALHWHIFIVFLAVILLGLIIDLGEGIFLEMFDIQFSLLFRAFLATLLIIPIVPLARHYLDKVKRTNINLALIYSSISKFLLGFILWLIPAIIIVLASVLFPWANISTNISFHEILRSSFILFSLLFFAHILPEELIFRGYIQENLSKKFTLWPVVYMQTALFVFWGQIVNASFDNIMAFIAYGIFLGLLKNISDDIWTGIGLRMASAIFFLILSDIGYEINVDMSGIINLLLNILPLLMVFFLSQKIGQSEPREEQKNVKIDKILDDAKTNSTLTEGEKGLKEKGIMYDVGTSYSPGQSSRKDWKLDVVKREISVIRDDLHCNAIIIIGNEISRLMECAEIALEKGLYVWLQPRVMDSSHEEMLDNLKKTAREAEKLREKYSNIALNVGCELSFFTAGIIPGRNFTQRTKVLSYLAFFLPFFNWRLNKLLKRAVSIARNNFKGLISYGAGSWEDVDWNVFDVIGLDYYYDFYTKDNYLQGLRKYYKYDKPIIITEFGCCSYEGAELKGGNGASIQDWSDLNNRKLKGHYIRNEKIQADYIGKLIDIFEIEGLFGAYVCMFIEGDLPYSDDPIYDLDMASFGIVKPYPVESGKSADDGYWEPKLAFYEIAKKYKKHRIN